MARMSVSTSYTLTPTNYSQNQEENDYDQEDEDDVYDDEDDDEDQLNAKFVIDTNHSGNVSLIKYVSSQKEGDQSHQQSKTDCQPDVTASITLPPSSPTQQQHHIQLFSRKGSKFGTKHSAREKYCGCFSSLYPSTN